MKKSCKKITHLLFCFMLFVFGSNSVFALDSVYYTNNNGIEISEVEYNNLLNLGFTDNEIQYMSETEFLANKDLVGQIVSQETTFIQNNITPFGLQPGYVEDPARILTTTIVAVSDRYRYKVSLEWQQIPSARSHDVIGIGIDSNVSIYSNLYFQQNFCYSSTNCSSTGAFTQNVSSTGASATFQLPSTSIVSMNSYLYFSVAKNTTSIITQLNAYGDYAHAMQNVTLANATNHTINRGGINHASSVSSYYDTFPVAKAIWTGSW